MLKFYINKKNEKVYTLKSSQDDKQTLEAHYKFIKFKDEKERNNPYISKQVK